MEEEGSRLKKILAAVAACAGTVLVVLATAVACIEGIAFDRGFYEKEYAKLDTAAYVGVDEDTLWNATDTLLEYLEGKRPALDMKAEIGGIEREYYSEREKSHMVDVAALNAGAMFFMQLAYPLGAVLIVAAVVTRKKASAVLKCCFFSILGVIACFGVLGALAAADFNTFWNNFHHVFFTNDLWQLDPATSLMIRMFEQTFFFDMVALILALFLAIIIAALAATGLAYKKLEKKCGKRK